MIKKLQLKKSLLVFGLACLPMAFQAQEVSDSTAAPTANPNATSDLGKKTYPMSAGIHAGANGIGAQYSINVLPFLSARAEGNYIAKKNYMRPMVMDGVDIDNDISVTTGFVGLFADFHSPKASVLNLTLGVVYDLTTLTLVQNASANDTDLGTLTLEATINKINPYAGIFIGNTVPKKKVGVGLEIGTYYIGSPTITWEGTGTVGPTADQADQVQENVKDYSWMPVFSLHLNFKIN